MPHVVNGGLKRRGIPIMSFEGLAPNSWTRVGEFRLFDVQLANQVWLNLQGLIGAGPSRA
jgi:ketopantoate hydroxymethyltransferase